MRAHITVKGIKYRVVQSLYTFEEGQSNSYEHEVSPCNGCVFESVQSCRTRFRSGGRLKCVDGDEDAMSDAHRTDYILIHNTREALAEYVSMRLDK